MQTLARLFGRSPFISLQLHMQKVAQAVHAVRPLIDAVSKNQVDVIEQIAQKISSAEHEANQIKHEMRNQFSSSLFMPVARSALLELLSIQDALADHAKDVAILFTLKSLVIPEEITNSVTQFVEKNLFAFEAVVAVISELDRLLESSFGGYEANKVVEMIDRVAVMEHEVDVIQRQLLKVFFSLNIAKDAPTLFLWMKIFQSLAALSNDSERLANRVRMLLEVK